MISPYDAKALGRYLRARRTEVLKTRSDVALFGLWDVAVVAAWEDGRSTPSAHDVPVLALALRIPADNIYAFRLEAGAAATHAEPKTALGRILRSARVALGLPAARVARDVGVETSTLLAWERGEHSPDLFPLALLVPILDLDADAVLAAVRKPNAPEAT